MGGSFAPVVGTPLASGQHGALWLAVVPGRRCRDTCHTDCPPSRNHLVRDNALNGAVKLGGKQLFQKGLSAALSIPSKAAGVIGFIPFNPTPCATHEPYIDTRPATQPVYGEN